MVESLYNNIYLSGRIRSKGSLALTDEEIRWKGQYVNKTVSIPAQDILELHWTHMGQLYQLKVVLQSGTSVRFQGFRSQDKEVLDKFSENAVGKKMEIVALATNGWNWGSVEMKSSQMRFMVDDKLAFELPYSDIAQSVVQGKNEVSFEFHQDDTVQPDEESLVEMRLYIPPTYKGASNDEESIVDLDQAAPKSAVELFQSDILDRAQLGEKDESIASFEDVLFLTPRGRYDLEVYGAYFKLHGKSYSYKILHKSVNRIFILPRPAGQTTLVISLDPAIRQGNTTHPFLQLSFKDEDEIELKPNLPEDVLAKKYEGKLASVMTGTYFEILSSVLSAFTNRKINSTGAFETAYGDKCIKCSHKANDGFFFPLEKSFFFIHKPPVYIRHEEVSSVEFLRIIQTTGTASRTFDVLLNLRNSEHLSFTGMNREEFKNVYEYMQSKNLRILNADELSSELGTTTRSGRKSVKATEPVQLPDLGDDEDSEEDEDFKAAASESDEDEYSDEEEGGESKGGQDRNDDEEEEEDEDDDNEEEEEESASASPKSKKRQPLASPVKSSKKIKRKDDDDDEEEEEEENE